MGSMVSSVKSSKAAMDPLSLRRWSNHQSHTLPEKDLLILRNGNQSLIGSQSTLTGILSGGWKLRRKDRKKRKNSKMNTEMIIKTIWMTGCILRDLTIGHITVSPAIGTAIILLMICKTGGMILMIHGLLMSGMVSSLMISITKRLMVPHHGMTTGGLLKVAGFLLKAAGTKRTATSTSSLKEATLKEATLKEATPNGADGTLKAAIPKVAMYQKVVTPETTPPMTVALPEKHPVKKFEK